ncbi:MAG TPA: response regulator [Phenylobacterium sp.]|uniref:response regulator n=1 Tax=Phenylobacterium sp. TaxID=1871053 RepID=UPI002B468EF5|nr:response regulator [Phenylobacterium sp.]HKR87410.1 response regulator [Phenylobacterium sp.]
MQILHVDDDLLNLRVVEDIMCAFGQISFGVSSGEAALEQLGQRTFDLVLMDIHMPGMSGVEVVQRLRASVGPERRTPVIALTADCHSRTRAQYLQLGFQDYVTKPILVSQLWEAITKAVGRSVPEAEQLSLRFG